MRGWRNALGIPLVIGVLAWLSLFLPAVRSQKLADLGLSVPVYVAPVAGLFVGASVALIVEILKIRTPTERRVRRLISWQLAAVMLVMIMTAVAVGLSAAVSDGDLHGARAVLVALCACLTIVCTFFALEAIRSERGISVESHWGGLGGGLGGWRLSSAAASTVLALIFAAATIAIASTLGAVGVAGTGASDNGKQAPLAIGANPATKKPVPAPALLGPQT